MEPVLGAVVALAIILASLVIHENAHAITALRLGDPTAKEQGRITLNPLVHLDIVGSVILPAFLFFATGSAFGYAKPVPVNRFMLRGGDRGFAIVALAGPASNVVLAFVSAMALRLFFGGPPAAAGFGPSGPAGEGMAEYVLGQAVLLNVLLAAFNLLPVPPLDGSRLIRPFVGRKGVMFLDRLEPYGFVILFLLLYLVRPPYFPFDPIGWFVGAVGGLIFRLIPL